jgi:hypothetical protein
VPFKALTGSLKVYDKVPLVVSDERVVYQILFLSGVMSGTNQLRPQHMVQGDLHVSQCLTNTLVYILPVEIGVSASSELYNVPFGAAVPLYTIAVIPFPRETSFTPLIEPRTDPASMGLFKQNVRYHHSSSFRKKMGVIVPKQTGYWK